MGSHSDHLGLQQVISDLRRSHDSSHDEYQDNQTSTTSHSHNPDTIFYLQQLCSELKHRYSPHAIASSYPDTSMFKLNEEEYRLLQAFSAPSDHDIGDISSSEPSIQYPKTIYTVRFKRLIEVMTVPDNTVAVYNTGDIVVADTKFGRNIGVIIENVNSQPYLPSLNGETPGYIIGLASPDELVSFQYKLCAERVALEDCREIIAKRNVDMDVLDAEYQMDGEKLAFFFTSKKWVNYRNLLASLHNRFQTRICMIKIADPALLRRCHTIADLESGLISPPVDSDQSPCVQNCGTESEADVTSYQYFPSNPYGN